jgi:hypothetical protein
MISSLKFVDLNSIGIIVAGSDGASSDPTLTSVIHCCYILRVLARFAALCELGPHSFASFGRSIALGILDSCGLGV